jgi:hypothetical protein
MPQGFESGLRYLAPALVLGLALLPTVRPFRERLASLTPLRSYFPSHTGMNYDINGRERWRGRRMTAAAGVALALIAIAAGYLVQREYLRDRYANPTFTAPGLDAAFRWATPLADSRIATTSTRQYPLFGTDLSNRVEFVGEERPHGGFVAPSTCRAWRRLLDAGGYDYVVASRDRIEQGKAPYPETARWTEGPGATVVLSRPPTVVFRLGGPLPLAGCG